jgi:hypothetical protein
VAKDEGVSERVGERADADLQRSRILDEGRGVKRHGVVGERYRLFRRREQWVMRALGLEDHVALIDINFGSTRHVGQLGIDLDGEGWGPPGGAALSDVG